MRLHVIGRRGLFELLFDQATVVTVGRASGDHRRSRGRFWPYLVCGTVALALTLAASAVFFMRPEEIGLVFVCAFLTAVFLFWLGHGVRIVAMTMISSSGGLGRLLTRAFILLVVFALVYWVGTVGMETVDQGCRADNLPQWACL